MPSEFRASLPRSSLAASANHLRARQGHEHSRVTNVELFFDLVFVFAVTQLSHCSRT
jgi:low temperature requirement protein LtrA